MEMDLFHLQHPETLRISSARMSPVSIYIYTHFYVCVHVCVYPPQSYPHSFPSLLLSSTTLLLKTRRLYTTVIPKKKP